MQTLKRAFNYVVKFYWGDGIAADVPALAYYLLISLAPFLLGVTAVGALVTDPDRLIGGITGRISNNLPPEITNSIASVIQKAHIDSPWLLALALFGCLWTCSGAVGVIARCENRLLGKKPLPATLGRLHEMFLAGGVIVMVVVMLMVGATAGGAIPKLGLQTWWVPLTAWAVTLVCLATLFVVAPRGGMRPTAALVGALPVSLFLQIVPSLVGFYVRHVGAASLANIFFLLVILVIGCSLSAQAILICVGVATRWQKRGDLRRKDSDQGQTKPE